MITHGSRRGAGATKEVLERKFRVHPTELTLLPRMKKQKLILGFIGILLVAYFSWLVFGSGDWFFTHGKNTPNRAALLKIREAIHIGDGYESVLRSYWQHAPKDLTLYAGSLQTWTVSMPYEFAATNWVLYIEFRDGKVSPVKVRTSDGPRPNDAPADVGG